MILDSSREALAREMYEAHCKAKGNIIFHFASFPDQLRRPWLECADIAIRHIEAARNAALEEAANIAASHATEAETCVHRNNPHWLAQAGTADDITDDIRTLIHPTQEFPKNDR